MKRDERQKIEALNKAIGYNVKQLREGVGKTVLDVELATQIDAAQLVRYEKGEISMSMIDLVKVSQYFGVEPGVLLKDIPTLIQAAEPHSYSAFSDAHAEEFQQNFLKVTGPGRGDKFKRFIKKLDDNSDD